MSSVRKAQRSILPTGILPGSRLCPSNTAAGPGCIASPAAFPLGNDQSTNGFMIPTNHIKVNKGVRDAHWRLLPAAGPTVPPEPAGRAPLAGQRGRTSQASGLCCALKYLCCIQPPWAIFPDAPAGRPAPGRGCSRRGISRQSCFPGTGSPPRCPASGSPQQGAPQTHWAKIPQ